MSRMPHDWTREERNEILRLWEEETTVSAEEIAKRFNTTKNAIIGMCHRAGVTRTEDTRPIRTTADRLNALNATMDALLAEDRALKARGEHRARYRPSTLVDKDATFSAQWPRPFGTTKRVR